MNGAPISEKKYKYTYVNARTELPRVVGGGSNGYEEVKDWFTQPLNLKWLCESGKLNFDYTLLENSPDYKLLIEPIVYISIANELYAMTATEGVKACQADKMVAYNLASILRRQAPISLFLAKDDAAVGISAYTGPTDLGGNDYVNPITAIAELGVGIVYFNEEDAPIDPPIDPSDPPIPPAKGYAYDFICNSVSTYGDYEEENPFETSATFEYQQKIECFQCDKHCEICKDTGYYSIYHPAVYATDNRTCSACSGNGCDECGGDGIISHRYLVSAAWTETLKCYNTRCWKWCSLCKSTREVWYASWMPVTAPTKSTTVEFLVDGGRLDYHNDNFGMEGDVKYSQPVTLTADSSQSVGALLNAGTNIGTKKILARINWSDKGDEFNTSNNSKDRNIAVDPATNLQVEYITPNAGFRTDTEVVTSFLIGNEDADYGLNVRPRHDLNAVFQAINPATGVVIATSTVSSVVIPRSGSNLVYFKWRVPADFTASEVKLQCSINTTRGVKESDYTDNVAVGTNTVDAFQEQIPPDTVFENTPSGFSKPTGLESTPTRQITDQVIANAHYEQWEWDGDFTKKEYSLSLSAEYMLTPDSKSPSHKLLSPNQWQMRSGYGIELAIKAKLSGTLPSSDAYTTVQNGNAYLPEYKFKLIDEKYRTLEETAPNVLNFPQNPNTITNKGIQDMKRIHFIPLWYPDGAYKVKTYLYECWTPAGMLSMTQDVSAITLEGDMYDDWYISHAEREKE